jgi:hypothetical protein
MREFEIISNSKFIDKAILIIKGSFNSFIKNI